MGTDLNKRVVSIIPRGVGLELFFQGEYFNSFDATEAEVGDLMLFGNNTADAVIATVTKVDRGQWPKIQFVLTFEYEEDDEIKEGYFSFSTQGRRPEMFRYFCPRGLRFLTD